MLAAVGAGPARASTGTDQTRVEQHRYPDPSFGALGPGGTAATSANASLNGQISVEAHVSEFADLGPPADIDLPFPGQSTATARAGLVRSFPVDAGGVYEGTATLVPTTAGVSMRSDRPPGLFTGVSATITAGLDVAFSCSDDVCASVPLLWSRDARVIACDSAGTCNNPGSVRLTARISIPAPVPGIVRCFAWLQSQTTARGLGAANAHGDTYVSQLDLERV